MSELWDAGRMIEAAEQAAIGEDYTVADELLRAAARIQEAELGPLHPDLANTLNNRAIVAERAGRFADAETLYRRAVAIASASLPANHPMIAASRENLAEFCRAHGLPIDLPAFLAPMSRDMAVGLDAFDHEGAAGSDETPADAAAGGIGFTPAALRPPSDSPSPVPVERPPAASAPLPAAPRRAPRLLAWSAIAVVVFGMTAFLVSRPWWSRETSTPSAASATPVPPPAAEPAPAPRAAPPAQPAPIERARTPPVAARSGRPGPASKPPASSPAAAAISLATAQLCRTLSSSGANWRCDQAADPVTRGPVFFYTRVRTPRDAVVVHRWYRRDALRQSVKLPIRASATEGYRTYSRQTVDAGDWRVEITGANGAVLYERRFTVR
jgi:hypothetical protein